MDRLARNGLTEKVTFNERHDDSKSAGPADLGGESRGGGQKQACPVETIPSVTNEE